MNRIIRYVQAVVAEMKHVKWPTSRQATMYTLLVLGISAVTMVIVSIADFIFTTGVDAIINAF